MSDDPGFERRERRRIIALIVAFFLFLFICWLTLAWIGGKLS